MANSTHLSWLLEGKDNWNARRESEDFQPNFFQADIVGIFRILGRLDPNGKVPLTGFNLSDGIFTGAILDDVNFSQADLRSAKFAGGSAKGTDFTGVDLTGACFGPMYLGDAIFSSAKLVDTDLSQPNLTGTDFSWSRLWNARLYGETNLSSRPCRTSNNIKSVSDLIKRCLEIRSRDEDRILYFRGERDYRWELRPSVMRRSQGGGSKLRENEGAMLLDLKTSRPEDFSDTGSAFEQLVLAQHYGIKTRLLDVSRNPCVALFSACDERETSGKAQDNSMDGQMHVFAVPKDMIKPFDSDTVSVIANLARLDVGYQDLLLGWNGEDTKRRYSVDKIQHVYSKALRRIYHFIREEKSHFERLIDPTDFYRVFVVEPKQSFDRIRAQEGAFIVSAFHERFERDEILASTSDLPIYDHDILTVPRNSKPGILEELDLLNFRRETLYPGLDEMSSAITQRYS